MPHQISWDDWRIVRAIASTGTTSAAAKQLKLNQSTVFRRITQLESVLGVRLFERDKRGFRLSPEGEAILPDVDKLHRITTDIERQVLGFDDRPEGEVKMSVNATVLRILLSKSLRKFRDQYPNISLRLDVSDRLANLKEREADLVIRGSNDPDPNLFGRKIMRLAYAIYAGTDWIDEDLRTRGLSMDLTSLDWIGYQGGLTITAPATWMRENLPGIRTGVSASDVESMVALAADGHGCAVLPRFMADPHPGISPISETIPGLYTELWVLTHQDLRKTARVSALMKCVIDAVRAKAS
ncbi:MAG: LysR family transcriptional regulator [Pseudomonadota bacterium]